MKIPSRHGAVLAALAGFVLLAAACGSDDDSAPPDESSGEAGEASSDDQSAAADDDDRPTIVVTTNVLGNVVDEIVGDQANVVTIMPVGADPHDFQASAREVDQMVNADALVVNGVGFEEGLTDVIDNAANDGVPTFTAIAAVETIEFGADRHEHDDGEEHSSDDGGEHVEDGQGDADPHFFADPVRMAAAVDGVVGFLTTEVPGLDSAALEASAATYVAELEALDAEVASLVEGIAADRRVLVTNHEVFGYFADRYGFEVVGVVIPGGSTTDSASAGELADLAEVIEAEGVPAIFGDVSSSDELIVVLAGEVGDVAVVELYSESLGEPGSDGETYLDMVRSNAERIAAALA